jgi:hypothetical protein
VTFVRDSTPTFVGIPPLLVLLLAATFLFLLTACLPDYARPGAGAGAEGGGLFATQPGVFRPAGFGAVAPPITEFTLPQDAADLSDPESLAGITGMEPFAAATGEGDTAFEQVLAAAGFGGPGQMAGNTSSAFAAGIQPIPTPLPSSFLLLVAALSLLGLLPRHEKA